MLAGRIDIGRTEISVAEGLGANAQAALDQVTTSTPRAAVQATLDRADVGDAAHRRAEQPRRASASTCGSAPRTKSSCAAAASTWRSAGR